MMIMKKICLSIVGILGIILFAACSSQSGAEKALQGYFDAIQKKDFKALVGGMNFKKMPSEEEKEQFAALLETKAAKELEKVKEYKVLRDSVLVEDSLSVVFYQEIMYDGTVEEQQQKMVKRDGKWLMDVGK